MSRRVAVIHDWLTRMGCGESVLEAILDGLPQAQHFTLFHFPGTVSRKIESRPIHTSSLQRIASRISDYRKLLPLFPSAVEKWDLSAFDLIISSSHCVAKGVDSRGKPHLCYCHTPMRYIWDRFDDYFPRSRPLLRATVSLFKPGLRRWDVKSAARVTQFIANSNFVRDRIRQSRTSASPRWKPWPSAPRSWRSVLAALSTRSSRGAPEISSTSPWYIRCAPLSRQPRAASGIVKRSVGTRSRFRALAFKSS